MTRILGWEANTQRPLHELDSLISEADRFRDAMDPVAAASVYESAVAMMPTRTDVRIQFGNMLKGSGQAERAVEQYRICLAQNPSDFDAMLQLSRALIMLGRKQEAETELMKASEINPAAEDVRALLSDLVQQVTDASGVEEDAPLLREVFSVEAPSFDEEAERRRGAQFLERFGSRSPGRASIASAVRDVAGLADRGSQKPAVTVILIVRGRVLSCLSTLDSLGRQATQLPFETIVYDSGTPADLHADLLSFIPWVRYIRSERDESYGVACSKAGALARGSAIIFLAASSRCCEGWLDWLVPDENSVSPGFYNDGLVSYTGHTRAPGGALTFGARLLRRDKLYRSNRTVLVIDHLVPEPDRDAGSRSVIDMCRNLQADGSIVKFWPGDLVAREPYAAEFNNLGIEILHAPWVRSFDDWIASSASDLDLVVVCRPSVALRHLRMLKAHFEGPIAFYGHDLHSARMRRQMIVQGRDSLAAEAENMERAERRIWRQVDAVFCPSQEEAESVKALEPSVNVHAIKPFCYDVFHAPVSAAPVSRTILFVAGFNHDPNVDAAVWLVTDVLPLIRAAVPSAKLWIVGSNPTDVVRSLRGDGIEVTGSISHAQLEERYKQARVAVVPLRFGAGVKLKVVEALHWGLPLVTTPVGAQGLEGVESSCLVRNTADEIATAIISLIQDDQVWMSQSNRQLRYARRMFTRDQAIKTLQDACDSAIQHADGRRSSQRFGMRIVESEIQSLERLATQTEISDMSFVDEVYDRLLLRLVDPVGASAYTAALASGHLTRSQLIEVVSTSDEYIQLTRNRL